MNERIKELRSRLGLTQEEFSSKIGLSRNFIAQIETGTKNRLKEQFLIYVKNLMSIKIGFAPETEKCLLSYQKTNRFQQCLEKSKH